LTDVVHIAVDEQMLDFCPKLENSSRADTAKTLRDNLKKKPKIDENV
jgi:hypothetical protein